MFSAKNSGLNNIARYTSLREFSKRSLLSLTSRFIREYVNDNYTDSATISVFGSIMHRILEEGLFKESISDIEVFTYKGRFNGNPYSIVVDPNDGSNLSNVTMRIEHYVANIDWVDTSVQDIAHSVIPTGYDTTAATTWGSRMTMINNMIGHALQHVPGVG